MPWESAKSLILIVLVLLGVAYYTLAERHYLSAIQKRKGPNIVGFLGLLQPIADGLKLLTKEVIIPSNVNKLLYLLSPCSILVLSMLKWTVIPFNFDSYFTVIEISLLFVLAISSLGVYGIIIAGWSSNSKYAFLGSLRSAAQMISYEVSISLMVVCILLLSGSLDLLKIIEAQTAIWYCIPLLPISVMFFISILAETNRPPFDLPEAEAELVAGYNIEYSGFGFAMFFLGEYSNMLIMGTLLIILFFGGFLSPFESFIHYPLDNSALSILSHILLGNNLSFSLKILITIILYIGVRALLPRYRYDQLMNLGWKVFLPISLAWLMLTCCTLIAFNWLPISGGFIFLPYSNKMIFY